MNAPFDNINIGHTGHRSEAIVDEKKTRTKKKGKRENQIEIMERKSKNE